MLGGAFEQNGAGEKKSNMKNIKGWGSGGGGSGMVFYRGLGHIYIKYITSSCEVDHLIETHLYKLVCDTPIIARVTHICRGFIKIQPWHGSLCFARYPPRHASRNNIAAMTPPYCGTGACTLHASPPGKRHATI